MGEGKRSLQTKSDVGEPMIVDTPGGRVHVNWDMRPGRAEAEDTVERRHDAAGDVAT
jgi:hypothetical protein